MPSPSGMRQISQNTQAENRHKEGGVVCTPLPLRPDWTSGLVGSAPVLDPAIQAVHGQKYSALERQRGVMQHDPDGAVGLMAAKLTICA